ncbi:MAG TPA: hypothetical protein PLJ97_03575 [Candidatus Saccharibacteria bacterium]|nr:hypothetical protein [Candidatus Saccharibacteria bacterium]
MKRIFDVYKVRFVSSAFALTIGFVFVLFPAPVASLLDVEEVLVGVLGVVIVSLIVLVLFPKIKCEKCNLRLIPYAMTHQPASSWLAWLLNLKQCPKCQKAFLESSN